ncbi:MAG: hypothetical protein JW732_09340 [Dehalococcoidia bacterium]|nr:hypothetical protein [Dehalococcoidia bacterium]
MQVSKYGIEADGCLGSKQPDSQSTSLQIHDELIFEIAEEEIEEMKSLVTELVPQAIKLRIPLETDIKTGKTGAR